MKLNKPLSPLLVTCRWQNRLSVLIAAGAFVPIGCNRSSSPNTNQIGSNANPNSLVSPQDQSELNKAMRERDIGQVWQIVKDNPQLLKSPDKQGNTPLHVAVRGKGDDNKTKIVEILLSHGANPDAKTRFGQSTPLHIAAGLGNVDVVKLLLSHKANVNATNQQGKTPLQEVTALNQRFNAGDPKALAFAEFMDKQNLPEIIALLKQSGAK